MSPFSTTHLSIPGESKLQNHTLQQAIFWLQLLHSTSPSSWPHHPPGSEWPNHLAPSGSSLPFSFMSLLPFQPRLQVCHFTRFPARTLHAVTLCPSFLSFRQSQLCQSNHLLSSLWSKSPDCTGWCQDSVVVCTLGRMCLSDSVTRAAEASCFLLKAMLTSLLCSVLYSKLTPCSKFIPSPSPRFPPQIKSLFKSHLLRTDAFVKSRGKNGIEWHEYIKMFMHAELVFRTVFKVLGTRLCNLKWNLPAPTLRGSVRTSETFSALYFLGHTLLLWTRLCMDLKRS